MGDLVLEQLLAATADHAARRGRQRGGRRRAGPAGSPPRAAPREGNIPVDWFTRQVAQADRTDGDIDTLSNRIAHVRTWTYVANRPDWLADPEHWQGVTRAVEDKLSDALHERLAERFVDRRTSVLMRRLRENAMLETEIGKTGEVIVEGHAIGRLDGFMFAPDASAAGSEAKALNAAAQKALAGEIEARATRLSQAPNDQIVLANDGAVRWIGDVVGRLTAGDDMLRPRVRIVADEHLTGPARELVQTRLDLWLKTHIEKLLAPLFSLAAADDVTGMARGVAFQLVEALGVLERQKVAEEVKGLDQPARATLRKYGVRFGAYHIYLPILLKPAPRALATQLWALKNESARRQGRRRAAASRRLRPHLDPGRQGDAEAALPCSRLSRVRRARGARRHSGAARRFDPAGAVVARGFLARQAGRRVRWPRLHGHRRDDLAHRRFRRGLRDCSALARLSHGAARETAGAGCADVRRAGCADCDGRSCCTGCSVRRLGEIAVPSVESATPAEPPPAAEIVLAPADAAAGRACREPAPEPSAPPAESQPATAEATAAEAKPPEEPATIEVWRPGGRSERRPVRHRRPPRQQAAATVPAAEATGAAAGRRFRARRSGGGAVAATRAEKRSGPGATPRTPRAPRAARAARARQPTQCPARRAGAARPAPRARFASRARRARAVLRQAFRGRRPAEQRTGSQFAFRQAGGAQGSSSSRRTGPSATPAPWIASASTNGYGTRAWCAAAAMPPPWWKPAMSASTASARSSRASWCGSATW